MTTVSIFRKHEEQAKDPYQQALELAARRRYHFHSDGSLCASEGCVQNNYNTPDPFKDNPDPFKNDAEVQ